MQNNNTKEVMYFSRKIAPGESITLKERVKDPATIEEVRIRFYQGQKQSLQVQPLVMHKAKRAENLVTFAGAHDGAQVDQFVAGDDDYFIFPVVVDCDYDDEVHIRVTNIDAVYTYSLLVQVVVDYYGGQSRVVGGVV